MWTIFCVQFILWHYLHKQTCIFNYYIGLHGSCWDHLALIDNNECLCWQFSELVHLLQCSGVNERSDIGQTVDVCMKRGMYVYRRKSHWGEHVLSCLEDIKKNLCEYWKYTSNIDLKTNCSSWLLFTTLSWQGESRGGLAEGRGPLKPACLQALWQSALYWSTRVL